jgi:hypothetical protein
LQVLDTGLLVRTQLTHRNSARFFRPVQLLLMVLGLATIWFARHPPMIDVPQHAAQAALLDDLLRGKSAWSELVWINLWTPYLLGYALLLPLIQIFSVATAIKLLLSAAYVCFVGGCFLLRRKFGSDEGLDIYAAVGFFGFAYYWGFLAFLVAAPLALGFVLLSIRLTEKPSLARALALFLIGLLLLVSHGLAFAFAFLIGGALCTWNWVRTRLSLWLAAPFLGLSLCTAIYMWWSRSIEAAQGAPWSFGFRPDWGLARFLNIPLSPFTGYLLPTLDNIDYAACFAILMFAPWIMGLRIDPKRPQRLIPLTITLLILLFVPSEAANAAFLYERFGLFLLPAYAWAFQALQVPGSSRATIRRYRLGQLAIVAASAWVLGTNAVHGWNFGREQRGIDAVIERLDEGQRALMLVFDNASAAAANRNVYLHYATWYQAERKGFVDFNFAWFAPLIVRFRRELVPPVEPDFECDPARFDWVRHRGANYKYFFVRGRYPDSLFARAECPPEPIWRGDSWTVFERKTCR